MYLKKKKACCNFLRMVRLSKVWLDSKKASYSVPTHYNNAIFK